MEGRLWKIMEWKQNEQNIEPIRLYCIFGENFQIFVCLISFFVSKLYITDVNEELIMQPLCTPPAVLE
jgi:hypothetical protein